MEVRSGGVALVMALVAREAAERVGLAVGGPRGVVRERDDMSVRSPERACELWCDYVTR